MTPHVPGRPSAEQQVVHDHGFSTNQTLQPLPAPTGQPPYRLDLDTILGAAAVAAIQKAGELRWHMVGDVGGVHAPQPQQIVANAMARDYTSAAPPSLLYLVGDVVYYNGERLQYFPQFYEPYSGYPGSIVAIPGNHDGDPLPGGEPSLAAFVDNFCAAVPAVPPRRRKSRATSWSNPTSTGHSSLRS